MCTVHLFHQPPAVLCRCVMLVGECVPVWKGLINILFSNKKRSKKSHFKKFLNTSVKKIKSLLTSLCEFGAEAKAYHHLTQLQQSISDFFLFLDVSHVYLLAMGKKNTFSFRENAFAYQDIVLITWNFGDQALLFLDWDTLVERARCSHC